MAVPEFQALARAGGAGLMATNQSYRDDPHEVYLALGAGAVWAPNRKVPTPVQPPLACGVFNGAAFGSARGRAAGGRGVAARARSPARAA